MTDPITTAAQMREAAEHAMPRCFAVYTATGMHVGIWDDGLIAAEVAAEYPGGRIDELIPLSAIRALPIARPVAGAEDALRVGQAIRDSFGTVSQPTAIETIGRAALAAMGYDVRE